MRSIHRTKKHLGQNFLTDRRIQEKIIAGCDLTPQDIVVEIGPGQGAITRLIAPHVAQVICIETDKDLIKPLEDEFEGTNVRIVHADFLKWDMSGLFQGVKVIGNIPYYISTPIIEKLIADHNKVAAAYLTVQLEFGERLAAKAGGTEYGSLSCFAQFNASVKLLFKIKNNCFKPAPKVDSCFISMDFTKPFEYQPKDPKAMSRLIRTVFTQRRKNILNAASVLVEKERLKVILKDLNISPDARPEQLNLRNFVDISDRLM